MANVDISKITIDTPIVCITKYSIDKEPKYGLSIRYYAGDNKLFANGKYVNNKHLGKTIDIKEFFIIVPYVDFNPNYSIEYYINKYK